jgi:hypothetical protein
MALKLTASNVHFRGQDRFEAILARLPWVQPGMLVLQECLWLLRVSGRAGRHRRSR